MLYYLQMFRVYTDMPVPPVAAICVNLLLLQCMDHTRYNTHLLHSDMYKLNVYFWLCDNVRGTVQTGQRKTSFISWCHSIRTERLLYFWIHEWQMYIKHYNWQDWQFINQPNLNSFFRKVTFLLCVLFLFAGENKCKQDPICQWHSSIQCFAEQGYSHYGLFSSISYLDLTATH